MKKEFDFYEFAGIILPGLIVLLFLTVVIPSAKALLFGEKLDLGEVGILVLVSYVVGHLMQGLTNMWEKVFWAFYGGMPTDWLTKQKQSLISEEQRDLIESRIPSFLRTNLSPGIVGTPARKWRSLTRQMYAAVQASGRSARIDTFNGNYGLLRGTVTAGLLIILFTFILGVQPRAKVICWVVGLVVLAGYRMQRFGVLYARELFAQFVQLDEPPAKT
jgi:hypothetical protein